MPTSSPIAFLALGDIHLDDLIWRNRREIHGDARVAFTSFVDLGIALTVPLVIVGDLFDTTEPPSSLVEFFRLEMERCKAAAVPVLAIQGNHDKRPVPWYTAASDWPVHIGDGKPHWVGTATGGAVKVAAFDYAAHDEIQKQLAHLATRVAEAAEEHRTVADVVLLHQAVKQALKFEGAWNCDLNWVPKEIPLVILGDLHRVAKVDVARQAWYTGSSHARNIEEIGPKSCLAVHVDLTVEQIPIDYRDFRIFTFVPDAPGAGQLPAVREWIRQAMTNAVAEVLPPVVWVQHTADQSVHVAALQEEFVGANVIIVSDPMTSAVTVTAQSVTNDLPGMPDMLARHIDPEKHSGAYSLAMALIDPTADQRQVLAERRAEFKAKRAMLGAHPVSATP